MKRLEGRVAIVTGAGRGIGRAVAKALAAQGAMVVVNNRSNIAQVVVDEISAAGGKAIPHTGDVGNRTSAHDLICRAVEEWDRIDIVVNNAGPYSVGTICDMSEANFDELIRGHLKGTFNTMQCAAPHFIKQDFGRFVNMISLGGIEGAPMSVGYSAAKAGIIGLTRATAAALIGHNVTGNCVAPVAATRMFDQAAPAAKYHFENTGTWPSEIAEGTELDPAHVGPLVVYLSSGEAANISGRVFRAGGLTYSLYSEYEEVAKITAAGGSWNMDRLFEEFPRTLGNGVAPKFALSLNKIGGDMVGYETTSVNRLMGVQMDRRPSSYAQGGDE